MRTPVVVAPRGRGDVERLEDEVDVVNLDVPEAADVGQVVPVGRVVPGGRVDGARKGSHICLLQRAARCCRACAGSAPACPSRP